MATNLVAEFEDRTIEIMPDAALRDDLRKPEKITSPGGRVSIAAARDVKDHADRFWAIALAIRASLKQAAPFGFDAVSAGARLGDEDGLDRTAARDRNLGRKAVSA